MNSKINELIERMQELEEELEVEYRKKREKFHFIIREKRVLFAEEIASQQRKFKSGVVRYILGARLVNIVTAPIVYTGLIAFLLLDLFLFVYQTVCFPIYRIPKVIRADFLVFDREDLPYLNLIEKMNCFYCSYANGVVAYGHEVAARTEQFWCPIKHARRIRGAHRRYPRFFEFGDAESYRRGLERLRKELGEQERVDERGKS